MRTVPKIHPDTSNKIAKYWLNAIKFNENVLSVFPISSAGYHRVYNLIENVALCKTILGDISKYKFNVYKVDAYEKSLQIIFSNIFSLNLEFNSAIDLVKQLNKKIPKDIHHVFFIHLIDSWLEDFDEIFSYFSHISDHFENISFHFLTEKNVHKKETLYLIGKHHQLFQQIKYIPAYSKETLTYFIKSTGEFLDHPLNNLEAEQIFNIAGRHVYTIKQAVRTHCNNKIEISEIHTDISYKLKLSQLWNFFNIDQQTLIKQILMKQQIDFEKYQEDFDHLKALEIIEIDLNNNYSITINGFEQFINIKQIKKLTFHLNHLYINKEIVDDKFTKNELKLLSHVLSSQKKMFTKNEISEILTSNDIALSDWAIDKTIFRTRKKLNDLGINSNLNTLRGRGYIWQE